MVLSPVIINKYGEKLDILIEGKPDSSITVIFVHGFATDKHETAQYFDDLSRELGRDFRIIRFDFSGCGKSEGKLEEKDYKKWTNDLNAVIKFTQNKFEGKIYLIAQSMGCFITSMLNPTGIEKTVFTGIPNDNTEYIIERLIERFGSRTGAVIDFDAISIFPRSTGYTQKIGPTFWKILRLFQPSGSVEQFSKNTKLLLIHPLQDEVVGQLYLSRYDKIEGVLSKKIPGDHSFKIKDNRFALINVIRDFFIGS